MVATVWDKEVLRSLNSLADTSYLTTFDVEKMKLTSTVYTVNNC